MSELERREQHLLSGLGIQILVVGLLVFAYTQAFRQLKQERAMQLRLQEQLTIAREEVARQAVASPPLAALHAQAGQLQASWVSPDELAVQAAEMKGMAEGFHLRRVQIKASEVPAETLRIPMKGKEDLQVHLYPVEMTGSGTTPQIARLLAAASREESTPVRPLSGLDLRAASEEESHQPVQFTAQWLVPVSLATRSRPRTEEKAPGPASPRPEPEASQPPGEGRAEPFVSPFVSPSVLRIPPEKLASFQLTGILWDPEGPSCILNGAVVKPGDRVGKAQVVLITPQAVLLELEGEELLLRQ